MKLDLVYRCCFITTIDGSYTYPINGCICLLVPDSAIRTGGQKRQVSRRNRRKKRSRKVPAHLFPNHYMRNPSRVKQCLSPRFGRDCFALGPQIPPSDALLLKLAPILGHVLMVRKQLTRYRSHGASYGGMQSLDPFKVRKQLHQDVEKACLFTRVFGQLGLPVRYDPPHYSFHHPQYRLASRLAEPSANPFTEPVVGLACRLISSASASFVGRT
jgi:hypothetical protein